MNQALGNYGATISFDNASLQRQGNEQGLASLVNDIKRGSVDVVLFNNCNPVFEYGMTDLAEAISGLKASVALSYDINDTASLCSHVAPINHFLESWGDVEAKRGEVSLIQPTISPLFDTRQSEESMMIWAGNTSTSDQPYYDYLKKNWESSLFANQSKYLSFSTFWDQVLGDGVYSYSAPGSGQDFSADIVGALSNVSKGGSSDALEVQFIEPITIGNGVHANNPWLQEMPDPVTRCAWGNYLTVPVGFDGVKKFKGFNNLSDGDLAKLTIGDKEYVLPVVQQFGQAPGTVAVALGYGRSKVGDAGRNVGVNVNDSISMSDGLAKYYATGAQLSKKTGKEQWFSSVQYHHTMKLHWLLVMETSSLVIKAH
jgi:molybdopterin-containing oxidoreductase family iron-sulfur binding subunit